MSMIIDLFGPGILTATLVDIKEKIKNVPTDRAERRSYLLKEWSRITGVKLSQIDFKDVRV